MHFHMYIHLVIVRSKCLDVCCVCMLPSLEHVIVRSKYLTVWMRACVYVTFIGTRSKHFTVWMCARVYVAFIGTCDSEIQASYSLDVSMSVFIMPECYNH